VFREIPTIFELEMEVTSRCNERCIHCYIPHESKLFDIDKELAFDIMDQLKELNTLGITMTGGEPFLHQDIFDFLHYARKNDLQITILSNVTTLESDKIDELKKINVNQIQISLYSLKPDEHDSITEVAGSQKRTMANIERLLESDIPIQISCPVMRLNKNSYKNVLKWALDNKVRAHTDFVMMAKTNYDTSNLKNRLNLYEVRQLIKEIILYDEGYQAELKLKKNEVSLDKIKNQPVCGAGTNFLCITADGNLYPCAGWQGYTLGNVNKKKLKDIWVNSEKLNYLRKINKSQFPQCLECESIDYCSLCFVRNFNENNGDMFKVNEHFCSVAKLNRELAESYKSELSL